MWQFQDRRLNYMYASGKKAVNNVGYYLYTVFFYQSYAKLQFTMYIRLYAIYFAYIFTILDYMYLYMYM